MSTPARRQDAGEIPAQDGPLSRLMSHAHITKLLTMRFLLCIQAVRCLRAFAKFVSFRASPSGPRETRSTAPATLRPALHQAALIVTCWSPQTWLATHRTRSSDRSLGPPRMAPSPP